MAQSTMESITKCEAKNSIHLLNDALKNVCENNATYFFTDDSDVGRRLYTAFTSIIQHVVNIEPMVSDIEEIAKLYDFDEKTPGNGFRSFLVVVHASITYTIKISHKVCLKRDNILFRKTNIIRDIESCNELLETIITCLHHVITLTQWCPPGELFVNMEHSPQELLASAENINQQCFYGRCLGFQFCESMRNILKFISLSMAIFSEVYYNDGSFISKTTNSIWTSGKYVLDPDVRARRIVNISQNAGVEFCKAFWCLSESDMMVHLPSIISSSVAVSHVITIPPEPLQYLKDDGTVLNIPVATAHIGAKPLNVRLISNFARKGMVGVTGKKDKMEPPCSDLIVHCHGGGFVAQSSRSHEIYLREWAQALEVPILSVDYSLAPHAPFPRAIEEVFYAYCWAVNNCNILGSTGEHIILVGDSAGGNLCVGAAMKCVELGMRPPDGLFLAYVPFLVEFNPSPARMLCLMDPLLPFGFMMSCLKAYACSDPETMNRRSSANGATSSDTESFEEVSESDLLELQAHKSPISETSDTLTNVSMSTQPSSSRPSDPTVLQNLSKNDKIESQKYVSQFLEKYVLESDTESDGTKIHVVQTSSSHNVAGSSQGTISDQTFQQRFSGFVGTLTNRLTNWKNKKRVTPAMLYLDSERQRSLVDEFKFDVPRDPYLSPYWASDEVLKFLPPVRILSVELDPCLDDCVMFAKKLKKLNNNVKLDILSGLPHGFLNFTTVCKEAHQASRTCVNRITELLKYRPGCPNISIPTKEN